MSRALTYVCAMISALPLTCAFADTPGELSLPETQTLVPIEITQPAPPAIAPVTPPAPVVEKPFSPFTGKVRARKLRMRLQPDLDGHVVKELNKNDLLSIVGEKSDFYAVEPPKGAKAYVFRSFILDNVVEGNRVNIRLKPDLDAPIVGHLNAGDRVNGTASHSNPKWLEIAMPADTHFYVAKEFVENIGGPHVKAQLDKKKQAVEQLLESASLLTTAEFRKPFEEIDVSRINRSYNTVIREYTDFPEYVSQAKEALAEVQEAYLQKKISFLEEKANIVAARDEQPVIPVETISITEESGMMEPAATTASAPVVSPTDKMQLWAPVEEALYLSWAASNDAKSMEDFYTEEKLAATTLTGIVESYTAPVKNKPGDFILRDKDLPVAYVYSTQVNLQNLVGKKVTLIATPRNNNNFAFPAYFVLSAE